MEIQIMHLTAVHDIKAAGKHGVGGVTDLVDPASVENVNDFDKIVRMTVGGDIADIFFDQHAFLVDEMRETIVDLLLVDEDKLLVKKGLMVGLDEELNAFLTDLLSE